MKKLAPAGLPVAVTGRLSQRDEKEPQIMADWIGPLSGEDQQSPTPEESEVEKTLWIRLPDGNESLVWLKKLLSMFPGQSRTVDLHVQRVRKKLGLEDMLKPVYRIGYRLEMP